MKQLLTSRQVAVPLLALTLLSTPVLANDDDFADMDLDQLVEVDVFAASVLSAHIHKENDWMLGYGFKSMKMKGNRNGTQNFTTQEVHDSYMVAPVKMTMNMHMFHAMTAPSDDLTLMIMAMYMDKEMELLPKAMEMGGMNQMGGMTPAPDTFTTRSSGWSDISINANYIFSRQEADFGENEYGLSLGLSLPTGSINKKDFIPTMGMTARLPYTMQLGSGTYDVNAGLIYMGIAQQWYWGAQGIATIRTGTNDNDYRLGNKFELKAWLNRAINDSVSAFVRLDGMSVGNIHGADPMLNPMMVPTANPDAQGGEKLNLTLGTDFYFSEGMLAGQRLGFDIEKPLYENLDGPQMKEQWSFSLHTTLVF